VLHKKTFIALAAAVALGCVPMATNASAAGHPGGGHGGGGASFAGHGGGGHAMAGPARGGYYGGGPVYDSCAGYDSGYGYGGCPGYGVPLVGGVINGILGGYGPY
jgi:hypothetical protein